MPPQTVENEHSEKSSPPSPVVLLEALSGASLGVSTLGVIADSAFSGLPVDITVALLGPACAFAVAAVFLAPHRRIRFSPADGLLLVFLVYVVFKAPFLQSEEGLAASWTLVAIITAYYLVPRFCWSEIGFKSCVYTALATAAIGAIWLLMSGAIQVTNLRGTVGDLSPVGLSSTFIFAVVAWFTILARPRSSILLRAIAGAGAALALTVIMLSGTRGGVLSAAAALVVLLVPLARRRPTAALAVVLVTVAFVGPLLSREAIGEAILARMTDLGSGSPDVSTLDRFFMFADAWQSFLNSPIWGAGPTFFYPHNMFLEVLSFYGAVGGLLFFSFLFVVAIALRKCGRQMHHDDLARALVAVFIAYFVLQQLSLGLHMAKWLFVSAAGLVTLARRDELQATFSRIAAQDARTI